MSALQRQVTAAKQHVMPTENALRNAGVLVVEYGERGGVACEFVSNQVKCLSFSMPTRHTVLGAGDDLVLGLIDGNERDPEQPVHLPSLNACIATTSHTCRICWPLSTSKMRSVPSLPPVTIVRSSGVCT